MPDEFFSTDSEKWISVAHGEKCVSLMIESWPPKEGPALGIVLSSESARRLGVELIEQAASASASS